MKRLCAFTLFLTIAAFARGGATTTTPATSNLSDFSSTGTAYTVQSDGFGNYKNGVSAVQSILQSGGQWLLDTYSDSTFTVSGGRYSYITLGPANQASATATLPGIWNSWGTHYEPVRMIMHADAPCNFSTVKPGSPIYCAFLIRFGTSSYDKKGNATYYRLDMDPQNAGFNAPESQNVQVSCNTANSSGTCVDWYIDSVPPTSQSGGIPATSVLAQLKKITGTTYTKLGDFLLTFHFHVTAP